MRGNTTIMLKHFKLDEFKCPCCDRRWSNQKLLDKLDEARELAGIPFAINSGYRCNSHNSNVGGSEDSSHLYGLAADIHCTTSRHRLIMMRSLLAVGFDRVGVRMNFIHVDVDGTKPGEVLWLY